VRGDRSERLTENFDEIHGDIQMYAVLDL
jgi:hypothetical protein